MDFELSKREFLKSLGVALSGESPGYTATGVPVEEVRDMKERLDNIWKEINEGERRKRNLGNINRDKSLEIGFISVDSTDGSDPDSLEDLYSSEKGLGEDEKIDRILEEQGFHVDGVNDDIQIDVNPGLYHLIEDGHLKIELINFGGVPESELKYYCGRLETEFGALMSRAADPLEIEVDVDAAYKTIKDNLMDLSSSESPLSPEDYDERGFRERLKRTYAGEGFPVFLVDQKLGGDAVSGSTINGTSLVELPYPDDFYRILHELSHQLTIPHTFYEEGYMTPNWDESERFSERAVLEVRQLLGAEKKDFSFETPIVLEYNLREIPRDTARLDMARSAEGYMENDLEFNTDSWNFMRAEGRYPKRFQVKRRDTGKKDLMEKMVWKHQEEEAYLEVYMDKIPHQIELVQNDVPGTWEKSKHGPRAYKSN